MKYYTSTTEFNCGIDLHARADRNMQPLAAIKNIAPAQGTNFGNG